MCRINRRGSLARVAALGTGARFALAQGDERVTSVGRSSRDEGATEYLLDQVAADVANVGGSSVVAVDGALRSGATGIIASQAMMDTIEAIRLNGEP